MIITVTERGEFMRCRKLWDYASFNRQGWQPMFVKPALSTGRLWHMTQAEWALHPDEDPVGLCLSLAQQMVDELSSTYYTNVGAPISEMELGPTYEAIYKVRDMVTNYKNHWGQPLPEGFTLVAPEQTCVVPIPDTQDDACEVCQGTKLARFWDDGRPILYSSPQLEDPKLFPTWHWDKAPCPNPECEDGVLPEGHKLAGTLDGLLKGEDGRLYILERKTYGQRPKLEVLNMQDQFLAYLWILRKLQLGPVGGLAYDGVWKRATPPKGSELSDLFFRTLLTRNNSEMDSFGHQLTGIVRDMAYGPSIYMNRRWDGCWDCEFVEPCIASEKGENVNYILDVKYAKRPLVEDSTRELKHDPA